MTTDLVPLTSIDMAPDNLDPPPVVNKSPLDAFTFAHFIMGAGMGWFGLSWVTALAVASTWEIIERPLKKRLGNVFPNPSQDSDANMIGDVIAWMAGWSVFQLRGGR